LAKDHHRCLDVKNAAISEKRNRQVLRFEPEIRWAGRRPSRAIFATVRGLRLRSFATSAAVTSGSMMEASPFISQHAALSLSDRIHPVEDSKFSCCLLTERGVDVCNSVHDALFYVAQADCFQDVDALVVKCMDEACEFVLGDGYILKSDRDVVLFSADGYRYDPEVKIHSGHYQHEDGKKMWDKIDAALVELEGAARNLAEVAPNAKTKAQ
jgi:hypothetical protein